MKWLYLLLAVAAVAILFGIYISLQPERDQEAHRRADASVEIQKGLDAYDATTAANTLDVRMKKAQADGALAFYLRRESRLALAFKADESRLGAQDAELVKALHQCVEPADLDIPGDKTKYWWADSQCTLSHLH